MKNWDEKLQKLQQDNKIAGLSVAVTDKERLIYSGGFGNDSIERREVPASSKSLYRIASITKVVTGLTVMRLAEQGLLDLDKPIKEYVPWLTLSRPEAAEQMTLRHLLSHTSGLPVEYVPIGSRDEENLEKSLMEGLPELELKTLPADGVYLYSNWGLRLASYITQCVSGRLFSELADELVLRPLGMNYSTFHLCVAATYPFSLPHELGEDGELKVVHRINENATRFGSGGLYSNVEDLCKLARFLLNEGKTDCGELLLKPESLNEMFKMRVVDPNNPHLKYGLTMQQYSVPGSGQVFYGHLGNNTPYMGSLWIDRETGYGVATEYNTENFELRYKIPEMILAELSEMY